MKMKKIYNEPMLKVTDLSIEACMLKASLEIATAADGTGGGAGAKGNAMFNDDDAMPQAKSVWDD